MVAGIGWIVLRLPPSQKMKDASLIRRASYHCFGTSMRVVKMTDFPGWCLGILILFSGWFIHAQTPAPSEYQLKAAFIYNFTKFIDWPAEAFANEESPFVIGILGENPFGDYLNQATANKAINTHPITIQIFRELADVKPCHLLFVNQSKMSEVPEAFKKLASFPVLTVGESGQFIEAGGIVNFVEEARKIRFQINEPAAKAAKLKMSSKLLSLAVPAHR